MSTIKSNRSMQLNFNSENDERTATLRSKYLLHVYLYINMF